MFTFRNVSNLKWVNAEHTMFDCTVFFDHLGKELPFSCSLSEVDVYPHVTAIWNGAQAGDFGSIEEYVPPPDPTVVTAATDQPVSVGSEDF